MNQYDRPKVTVKKGPDQPDPTNQLPIHFDILIDEPVVDFPTGTNVPGIDIGGTATDLRYRVEGEKDTYRLTVLEVGGDGSIEVSVPEGACADLFGNINYASAGDQAIVHYDGTRPTCVVHSEQAGVVNNDTMRLALSFSEPVYGLQDEVLSVLENAAVTRVSGADGDAEYTFDVTPVRDGILAFRVPEDAVVDNVGNGNKASQVFSLIVDSTGPAVSLSSYATPMASNTRYVRVHARFTEPVEGFDKEDIAVTRGTLASFTAREDGRNFIFDVRPDGGPVTLHIPAGVATDRIGNPNRASAVFHRDYDPDPPVADIAVKAAGRYQGDAVPVEVRFNEPVFGYEPGLLRATGGVATPVAGTDGGAVYRYEVRAAGAGPVHLSVPAGAVRDAAGNRNRGARANFELPPAPPPTDAEPGAPAPPLIAE